MGLNVKFRKSRSKTDLTIIIFKKNSSISGKFFFAKKSFTFCIYKSEQVYLHFVEKFKAFSKCANYLTQFLGNREYLLKFNGKNIENLNR